MKKIKLFSVILITILIGVCFSACSQPSATPPVVYSVDPFAGTKWYGDTKDGGCDKICGLLFDNDGHLLDTVQRHNSELINLKINHG